MQRKRAIIKALVDYMTIDAESLGNACCSKAEHKDNTRHWSHYLKCTLDNVLREGQIFRLKLPHHDYDDAHHIAFIDDLEMSIEAPHEEQPSACFRMLYKKWRELEKIFKPSIPAQYL